MGNVDLTIFKPDSKVGYGFNIEGLIKNFGEQNTIAGIKEILWNNHNILTDKVSVRLKPNQESKIKFPVQIPSNIEEGPILLDLNFIFTEGSNITPHNFKMEIILFNDDNPYTMNIPLKLIIGIIAIIVFVILVIIFIRRKIEGPAIHKSNSKEHTDVLTSYSDVDSNNDSDEVSDSSRGKKTSSNSKESTGSKSGSLSKDKTSSNSTELIRKTPNGFAAAASETNKSVSKANSVKQQDKKLPKNSSSKVKIDDKIREIEKIFLVEALKKNRGNPGGGCQDSWCYTKELVA